MPSPPLSPPPHGAGPSSSHDLTRQLDHNATKNVGAGPGLFSAAQIEAMYPPELSEDETPWRDRYDLFLEHGLELRPRYRPGWIPSWLKSAKDPSYCEDAIRQILPMVLDAKRSADGQIVCIKRVEKKSNEVDIARYLSSKQLLLDTTNHCVPIYDSFSDPVSPEITYIVMPVLRQFDDPGFWVVGEVVDFVSQVLEGLAFMHAHLVAHGDLTGPNIMMDGRPIYPQGWHFVSDHFSPDGIDHLTPLTRIDHPVRYYIVDYDCAKRFLPGEPHHIEWAGSDPAVPELVKFQYNDPFKVDVFMLGNVFLQDLHLKYSGLNFLNHLIDSMMIRDPQQRPTADASLRQWRRIQEGLNIGMARWRLRKPDESLGERVRLDTVAVAQHGIHSLKNLFYDSTPTWTKP